MRWRNNRKELTAGKRKKPGTLEASAVVLCFLLMAAAPVTVFAAGNTGAITTSFKSIYNIIAAIVTSIGQLYLLWGVFEWATSLNSQDGTAQSMAFKRIAAGLIACMAPTIISMISY